MASRTDYVGKHAKPRIGIDSLTPRGPERWARAAHNALVNPLSAAAKLYADRVATARRFIEYEEARLPFEHREDTYEERFGTVVESKRKYVTCNIVCAAMQVQLDFGTTAYHRVAAIMASNYRRSYVWQGRTRLTPSQINPVPLNPADLKRDVRCQCCGTMIKAVK